MEVMCGWSIALEPRFRSGPAASRCASSVTLAMADDDLRVVDVADGGEARQHGAGDGQRRRQEQAHDSRSAFAEDVFAGPPARAAACDITGARPRWRDRLGGEHLSRLQHGRRGPAPSAATRRARIGLGLRRLRGRPGRRQRQRRRGRRACSSPGPAEHLVGDLARPLDVGLSNGFLPALSRMSMKPTRRPREKSGAASMRSLP